MKKIFPVIAISASILAFTSCSGSAKQTLDKASQTERLGQEWFTKVTYEDNANALNKPAEGDFEGAHFTLCAPTTDSISTSIKSHFVAIPKNLNKDGSVYITYASQRSASISGYQAAIAQVINDNKDNLAAKLPGYSIQTEWRQSYTVPKEDNVGVFVEYLPLRLNFYKDTDDTKEENALLFTYVIVPVKVTVTSYTLSETDTNYQTKYTFTDTYAEDKKSTLIDWTSDAYGQIK